MSEFRPCPFCGGTPKVIAKNAGRSMIFCPDCGASMMHTNPPILMERWNRRTEDCRIEHARRALKMLKEMTGYLEKESKTCWALMVNADDTNCLVSALIPIFQQLTGDEAVADTPKNE